MAIPFTAIVEYAKVYEVDYFDEFLSTIRSMDNEILRLERLRSSKNAKTKKGVKNG